ncbi:MAG: T9SS type A sorting domain-containing protein [Lachnoclostridium sp.]|nr:T9SS type A sorting domain-containing protein [Lachnoclostridium sp.]
MKFDKLTIVSTTLLLLCSMTLHSIEFAHSYRIVSPFDQSDRICFVNSATINDKDYTLTTYTEVDSIVTVDNNTIFFFKPIGDSLLLTRIESPYFILSFDAPVAQWRNVRFEGLGSYCSTIPFDFKGSFVRECSESATIIANEIVLSDLTKKQTIITIKPDRQRYGDSRSYTTIIKTTEEWFSPYSNCFPIARQLTTAYVIDGDTAVTTPISLIDISSIEEVVKKQNKEEINISHNGALSFSDLVRMAVNLAGVNNLEIQGSSIDGNDHEVTVDVFNTLGQRMAPSLALTITPEESIRTISLLTSQSGAYFVYFKTGNIIETIKVTQ